MSNDYALRRATPVLCNLTIPVHDLLYGNDAEVDKILSTLIKDAILTLPECQGNQGYPFASKFKNDDPIGNATIQNFYEKNSIVLIHSRPDSGGIMGGNFSIRLRVGDTEIGFWQNNFQPIVFRREMEGKSWAPTNSLYHFVSFVDSRNAFGYYPGKSIKDIVDEDTKKKFIDCFGKRYTMVTPQQARTFNQLDKSIQSTKKTIKDVAKMFIPSTPPSLMTMALTQARKREMENMFPEKIGVSLSGYYFLV